MVHHSGKFAPTEINPLATVWYNYGISNKAGLPHVY